jgi:hypothetical protein
VKLNKLLKYFVILTETHKMKSDRGRKTRFSMTRICVVLWYSLSLNSITSECYKKKCPGMNRKLITLYTWYTILPYTLTGYKMLSLHLTEERELKRSKKNILRTAIERKIVNTHNRLIGRAIQSRNMSLVIYVPKIWESKSSFPNTKEFLVQFNSYCVLSNKPALRN